VTLDDVLHLCAVLDREEEAAERYNEMRDRNPVEAALWRRLAGDWRELAEQRVMRRLRIRRRWWA